MSRSQIEIEGAQCLKLKREGKSRSEICTTLNMTLHQVKRRLASAAKTERLDPELARRLASQGIVDLAGLHSGWLIDKDESGAGQSLYFYLGPDEEKISFVDAIRDSLNYIPRLDAMLAPTLDGVGFVNWLTLADLHVGGDYGSIDLENDVNYCVDDLVRRMPKAEKAVLIELGDMLDANDHKGVTPHSGNPCDVIRDDHLTNTQTAIRIMRRIAYRLAETHAQVEIHMIKGNHDPSAYIAVLLALEAHFENIPHIKVVVTDEEYRVIEWGQCAAFPHHGDTLKWGQLKDVFADQYPDAWAKAKAHRHIMTAHFHHDRKQDLVGATAEQYRTLHKPNAWAKGKGLLNRGSLTAMTVHKDRGEENRTISNIKPVRGKITL